MTTVQLLHEKHPTSKNADDEVVMSWEKSRVHPVIYENVDEDLVKSAALKTKGFWLTIVMA